MRGLARKLNRWHKPRLHDARQGLSSSQERDCVRVLRHVLRRVSNLTIWLLGALRRLMSKLVSEDLGFTKQW